MRTHLALAVIVPIAAVTTTATAHADTDAPSDCMDAVEQAATAPVFAITVQLASHRGTDQAQFRALRAALARHAAFARRPDVRACLATDPANTARLHRWQQRYARATITEAHARLDRICTHHASSVLTRARASIERALAAGRLADASRHADDLARAIDTDELITECSALADEVAHVRDDLLPSVRNRVALPKVAAELADVVRTLERAWTDTRAALATRGRAMRPAPAALADEVAWVQFRDRLRSCATLAQSLRALGADDDMSLPGARETTNVLRVRDAVALCREIRDHAHAVHERAVAHNATYRVAETQRWVRSHLKGWGMQQTYQRRGRPMQVEDRPGGIVVWTYRGGDGTCTRVRFTQRGKRLGVQTDRCPQYTAAH